MEYRLFIKEFRVEKKLTQLELAQRSHLKQAYISQLENTNNNKSPTLRTISNIAKALDVCPHLLVDYKLSCSKNCAYMCEQNFF